MLGVSTSLRSEASNSGIDVMNAVLDLGVEAVELEYRITSPMLQEILPLCRERRILVISLHNFFPVPEEVPKEKASGDVFSLSAVDKEERNLAIKYTLRTLEWAEELEVKAIILHMGKIPMDSPMETLMKLYDHRKIQTEETQEFIREQKKIRARKGQPHLEAAMHSLDRLAREAEKRGCSSVWRTGTTFMTFPTWRSLKSFSRNLLAAPYATGTTSAMPRPSKIWG